MDFRLPNLGEGIDSATVTAVLVKPGDAVAAGQAVVSVETDKAAVEVPAEAAGTVDAVLVKAGDKVPVGGPLLRLRDGAAPDATPAKPQAAPAAKAPSPPPPATAAAASAAVELKLPNLGEGIDSATVTAVLVKQGDRVAAGQAVIGVETDKAAVEVPAEADGVVEAVLVKPGDKLPVGRAILRLQGTAADQAPAPSPPPAA
ncbi:MAG: pyruvate dehydrogenase, partial [Gemmataceae bacterium]|nr:pyruvate dehydrogenase [Gemmataceae bacterium]